MTPLVKASDGDKVSLGCYATGTQPITYSWEKDNVPVISSATIKVIGNVVVIQPKTSADYGTYVCGVSSGRETATYAIKLELFNGVGVGPKSSQQGKPYLTILFIGYWPNEVKQNTNAWRTTILTIHV
jgi:hypothetical protein